VKSLLKLIQHAALWYVLFRTQNVMAAVGLCVAMLAAYFEGVIEGEKHGSNQNMQ
jgi:hypothetical protein